MRRLLTLLALLLLLSAQCSAARASASGSVYVHAEVPVTGLRGLVVRVEAGASRGVVVIHVYVRGVNVSCAGVAVRRGGVLAASVAGHTLLTIPVPRGASLVALAAETGLLMHGGWNVTTPYRLVNLTCRGGVVEAVYHAPGVSGLLEATLESSRGVLTYTYNGPSTGYEDYLAMLVRSHCGRVVVEGDTSTTPLPRLLVAMMPASPLQAAMYIEEYASRTCSIGRAAANTTTAVQLPAPLLLPGGGQAATASRSTVGKPAAGRARGGGGGVEAPYLLILSLAGVAVLALMLRRWGPG